MGIIQGSVKPMDVKMEAVKVARKAAEATTSEPTHGFFKKRCGGELDCKPKRKFGFDPMTGICVVCGEMTEGCSPDCLTQRMRWFKVRN